MGINHGERYKKKTDTISVTGSYIALDTIVICEQAKYFVPNVTEVTNVKPHQLLFNFMLIILVKEHMVARIQKYCL